MRITRSPLAFLSQGDSYSGRLPSAQLDQICISFDGGKTTMNFAEAALLIQGSACIYSKKVEYLYTLVYQALDLVSNKKRSQQPTSIGQDGSDKDADFPKDKEEEFLTLDDIEDPKKPNVDIKEDEELNPVTIIPLTPMSLVPPAETEKKTAPLLSQKGDIFSSRRDFRMNSCVIRVPGVFQLERQSPSQFNQNVQRAEDDRSCPGLMNAELAERNESMEDDCGEVVAVLNFSDADAPAMNNGNDVYIPLNDHHEADDENMEPAEHIQRQQIQAEERGYVLRQREDKEQPVTNIKDNYLDPWHHLDPFQSSEDKPFKKGKYFTIPRGVVDVSSNKRKRKLPSKLQDFLKWFTATYWDGAESMKYRRKGPTFADMEALYWKHAKERLAVQRQLQKRMGIQVAKVSDLLVKEEAANHMEEPRDDDYLDHEDGADLSDHEDLGLNIPPILTERSENIEPIDFNDHISYDEFVRKNVDLFMSNTQKYVQETVLSMRVREWEDKMGPQLQEQDERGAFDIHDYGDRLVSQFSNVGEWRTFASLMAHKEPYEVCRYMLASLQLANDYTVEVAQKPGLQEGVDTMALRLLTQQKAHERFKTYTAPSLSQQCPAPPSPPLV
ncbi:condensin-2 complex subunit H2 [Mantella aurantiaca]